MVLLRVDGNMNDVAALFKFKANGECDYAQTQ